jgi:SAM-dependent methyltransferase
VSHFGDDLAYVHDAGFTSLAPLAADRLLEEVHRDDSERGLVVELGCGPGVTAARLLAAGFDVLGIDSSPSMLAIARKRAPRATFVEGSFVSAEIPPCDAVIAVNEVFNYLSDTSNTPKALERVFARVFKALWPGGVLLFDMAGPGRIAGNGKTHSEWVGDDWGVLVDAVEDSKKAILTRTITTLRKTPKGIAQTQEIHRQRLVPSAKVLEMLRKAGFKARSLQGYDGTRFAPGHSVFLARRP